MKTRIAVIKGGGDWSDASVDVLVLAEGVDLGRERSIYEEAGSYRGTNMHFVDWLISRGARAAGNDDVQEITDF